MADPTKFVPGYDYTSWQASNPTKPLPGNKVDQDMANIATSIDEAVEAIKDVRRSDGALKNEIVTLDSLSPQVAAGVGAGALASAEAAAASADAASDSAVAAAVSATAADGSATDASGYASTALTYRNDANTERTLAQTARTGAQTARDFANKWAVEAEGVLVDDGVNDPDYSAYHWAQVALGAAAGSIPDGSVTTAKLADAVLSADAAGRAKMADGFVTSAKIADGTIATGDLADGAVTSAKIADGTIATGDIANSAVENAKLANMVQATVKGRASGAGTGVPTDLDATALFAILGGLVPAKPKTASGIGQLIFVETGTGNGYSLPAGGEWVWVLLRFNATNGALAPTNSGAGVATGGTTVLAGLANHLLTGVVWRIG